LAFQEGHFNYFSHEHLTMTKRSAIIRTMFRILSSNGTVENPVADEELSPRERRYQRTQQAILTAARAIVAEGGADKLSMRAIAERIDYSPAGLYEYYGSKEEIIGALCWEGHRTLKRYMAQVPLTLPPDQYLIEIGLAYIRFAVQNPDYFLLIFTAMSTRPTLKDEAPAIPPAEMMNEDSSFPLLVNGVERAVKSDMIRLLPNLTLLETAYAFWAIVHGAAMLQIKQMAKFKVDFANADRQMLTAFIHGLGS
jgi:AcrR family transcriptional regulator